jgi:xanthine/uracil permease
MVFTVPWPMLWVALFKPTAILVVAYVAVVIVVFAIAVSVAGGAAIGRAILRSSH